MSIKTWKAEFYPIEAKDATSSELEAAKHSLRKWEGLMAGPRRRHKVKVEFHDLVDGGGSDFEVSGTSILCVMSAASSQQDRRRGRGLQIHRMQEMHSLRHSRRPILRWGGSWRG